MSQGRRKPYNRASLKRHDRTEKFVGGPSPRRARKVYPGSAERPARRRRSGGDS